MSAVSRRHFLKATSGLGAGLVLGACSWFSGRTVFTPQQATGDELPEDADMLGWKGPSTGSGPALLPKYFAPGDSAPGERPKAVKAAAAVDKLGNDDAAEGVEALFVSKPKLSKEEKEIAKLEKAAAKGDAKAATKLQHLKVRQAIAAKRAAGEEVYTDDELEAAGLSAP